MSDQTLCNRATKKGTQCTFRAIVGSEFCRRHQPREIWIPLIFSIVLSFILGVICAIAIDSYSLSKSKKSQLSLRHVSRPRSVPAIGGFPVVIDDGIIVIVNKPGFVTHKVEEGPFDYRIAGDGAIKIYGEIKRADGTQIIEATGANIRILPSTGFDINSDSKACEIVDSNMSPIYQLSVVPYEIWKQRTDGLVLESEVSSI